MLNLFLHLMFFNAEVTEKKNYGPLPRNLYQQTDMCLFM
jgi:hypothetical protein